jgi:hypothetical protein
VAPELIFGMTIAAVAVLAVVIKLLPKRHPARSSSSVRAAMHCPVITIAPLKRGVTTRQSSFARLVMPNGCNLDRLRNASSSLCAAQPRAPAVSEPWSCGRSYRWAPYWCGRIPNDAFEKQLAPRGCQ